MGGVQQCQSYDHKSEIQVLAKSVEPDKLYSDENLSSESSQHSLQFKIRNAQSQNQISRVWKKFRYIVEEFGKFTEQQRVKGCMVSLEELIEVVGTMIVHVDINELYQMRVADSQQMRFTIQQIISFKNELFEHSAHYKQLLDKFTRYSFCEELNPQYLIRQYQDYQPCNIVHKRKEYDAFSREERSIQIKKIVIGDQNFALKVDTRYFTSQKQLQQHISESCQRLCNWLQLNSVKDECILKLKSASIERCDNFTLKIKSLFPFIDGVTLDRIISDQVLNSRQKVKIAIQMVESLQLLHVNGLSHGDIKPQNFLCTDGWKIILIDMDSLSRGDDQHQIDSTQLFIPQGHFPIPSIEADTWALGLSLYKLATNQKIIANWDYEAYRSRDDSLPYYRDGYGLLDEAIKTCLTPGKLSPETLNEVADILRKSI